MANFNFDDISTILNNIVKDVTGQTATLAARDTKDFVAQAETALTAGTDPIMQSISQMIARTVFAVRPYKPSVRLIDKDALSYGNAVRKITPIFTDGAETQPMYNLQPADGQSTDHYTIKRPKALETRFTGFSQWEVQAPTVFEDQLRTAFTGPDQLSEFMSAQITAVNNELASQKEALALNTVANFVGAKLTRNNSACIIHLLTEYNALTLLSLTANSVFEPDNFPAFIKWMYSRIEDISDLLTARSITFHEALTGYTIMRHTPKEAQRLLLYAPIMRQIQTMALSGIYHNDLLKMQDVAAEVPYWQNILDRMSISVDCSYTTAAGAIANAAASTDCLVGVLFDRDAMGINTNLESVNTTPLNAKGRYYNTFYHYARRYYNDITENAVIFLLD